MKLSKIIKSAKKQRNKMILEEYKKGISKEEIAKMFDVDKSTVYLIIRSYEEKRSER